MNLLSVNNVHKTYTTRFTNQDVKALRGVSFNVKPNEFIAIMGESGSGKSTLLNMIATLDQPTSGEILLNNEDITKISPKLRAQFRREQLGFVFQDFNLLDTLSIQDNIILPLTLQGEKIDDMLKKLMPLTQQLGITDLINKHPYELSGGEKQRTAIARALITQPKLLLADEPSGALDSKTSFELFKLFQAFNQQGQTILMVTHSAFAASFSDRVLILKDGQVVNELHRQSLSNQEFLNLITKQLG